MPKAYRLQVQREAQKEILSLPAKIRRQVEANIDRLLETLKSGQRPQDIKPLKGEAGCYRIDTGEYRIAFELDDETGLVTVFRARHRKDAYRNL